jgi:hypothetical protein
MVSVNNEKTSGAVTFKGVRRFVFSSDDTLIAVGFAKPWNLINNPNSRIERLSVFTTGEGPFPLGRQRVKTLAENRLAKDTRAHELAHLRWLLELLKARGISAVTAEQILSPIGLVSYLNNYSPEITEIRNIFSAVYPPTSP